MTVLHRAAVVVPVNGEPIPDGAVAVADHRVVAVGPIARLRAASPDIQVVTWDGVLTPGLVNAHTHLEYGPSFADLATSGLPFLTWIRTLTGRRRSRTLADWREDARAGVRQLIATGTTCVADVVTSGPAMCAVAEAGLAGVSYVEAVGADDQRWASQREDLLALLAAAPPGRAVGVSPHALYTLGTGVLTDCLALARERGLRIHTHLAETAEESEYVLAGRGPYAELNSSIALAFELLDGGSGVSPTLHLDALAGLGPDVHVAHGVHVDAADRDRLRVRRTSVALCPRSNATLGAGAAPVAAYLTEGNPLAIGTDSLASAPSLDLLGDVRAARDLAIAQGAPPDGLARRLVEAATAGGAAALGLADVGGLRPGARADLAVFAVDDPTSDPCEQLVASGRCVGTVIAGRLVAGAPMSGVPMRGGSG